jgi:hypothetical protein
MKVLNRVSNLPALDNEHKESDEFTDGNSLPLCYATFGLIKENYKLTKEEN